MDQFKFLKILGEGGFGRVFLVRDRRDQELYALKCLEKVKIESRSQQLDVFMERDMLGSLDSQFVVKLKSTFSDERCAYFVMEVCIGGDLATLIWKEDRLDGNEAYFYLGCIAKGLMYMHRNKILHQDIKPENILIDGQGYAKIADFGLSTTLVAGQKEYDCCGTQPYWPPELLTGKGYGLEFDWWSLGVVVYEMLMGYLPFHGDDDIQLHESMLQRIRDDFFLNFPPKFQIMEVCIGGDLATLIRKEDRLDGKEAYFYLGCIAKGIMCMHRNKILHQDIKPANILID